MCLRGAPLPARAPFRGFTLVELMIVVAIVGVLAALAIYGVRKYVLNAKTAEARNALGQMAKDATTAYTRERMNAALLPWNNTTGVVNRMCESATAVPASVGLIRGKKYQSAPADWTGLGWDCLRFSMSDPQYFQYNYQVSGAGGGVALGDSFVAQAAGDLDGDTQTSTFQIQGKLQADSQDLVLVLGPNIVETNSEE